MTLPNWLYEEILKGAFAPKSVVGHGTHFRYS